MITAISEELLFQQATTHVCFAMTSIPGKYDARCTRFNCLGCISNCNSFKIKVVFPSLIFLIDLVVRCAERQKSM